MSADTTTIWSGIATGLSLSVGWLDHHHAGISVIVAIITGTVACISGFYSIRIKHRELKQNSDS